MATDAQGRTLSDDGNYYWDGSAWQAVDGGATTSQAGSDTSGAQQGASLEDYSGDGSDLTSQQREYLSQYLVREPAEGPDSIESVGQGQLSDPSTEQEWA
jgi:hypothetical protein